MAIAEFWPSLKITPIGLDTSTAKPLDLDQTRCSSDFTTPNSKTLEHRWKRMSVTKDTFLTHNMVFPRPVPSQFGFPQGYNLISLGLRLVASTFDYDEAIPHIQLTEYTWRPLSLKTFPYLQEFAMLCLRPISCNYQEIAFTGEDLVNGLFSYTIVRLWIVGQRRGRYRMPREELGWTKLDLYSEFRDHRLNRIRDLWVLTRMRLENPIREEACEMYV
ncbi:uncharacterized protein BKA55DRAFT_231400 [Fusarium redolens]|uniref:Uncharacterized protein n=1 Tax=Fusarium redolens TaxID=48865 RepID=A0A9P9HW02_FUSRE|nr:uncharacterized protein BKA55DRAFT_231400 [Fusarium redolens]KAH7265023.1 hypothetical protein BKA55DRAFT_231400 [Fusarium redolens]